MNLPMIAAARKMTQKKMTEKKENKCRRINRFKLRMQSEKRRASLR
jgi:hypothetical protein